MAGFSPHSHGVDRTTRRRLVQRLNRDAAVLADRFGLRYESIEAERANVEKRYGVCDSDGVIKIRLQHVTPARSSTRAWSTRCATSWLTCGTSTTPSVFAGSICASWTRHELAAITARDRSTGAGRDSSP